MVGTNYLGEGGYSALGVKSGVTATFESGKLTQATVQATAGYPGWGADHSYSAPDSVAASKPLMDGTDPVLGWGKWTGGTATYMSNHALVDAHYIVGKATPLTEFQQMSGSYTYNKVGNTTPSSQVGTATLNSASLNVNFGGGNPTSVTLNVDVTAGGRNYYGSGYGSTYESSFHGSGNVERAGMGSNSLNFAGMFAGKNAKHAGVTFQIADGADGKTTRGAIGFSKGAVIPQ